MIRSWIKAYLLKNNAILSRPPGQFIVTPLRLKKSRDRGLKINFAVDGGASDGGWAREFLEIIPVPKFSPSSRAMK